MKKDFGVSAPIPDDPAPIPDNPPDEVTGSADIDAPAPAIPDGQPPVEFAKGGVVDPASFVPHYYDAGGNEIPPPPDEQPAVDLTGFHPLPEIAAGLETNAATKPGSNGFMTLTLDVTEAKERVAELKDGLEEVLRLQADVKAAIPAPVEPDITEPLCTFADLKAAVSEIKASIEALKSVPVAPVAPVSASVEIAPVIIEPPAPDIKVLVAEAVKSMDMKKLFSEAVTLAFSRIKGKVEAK